MPRTKKDEIAVNADTNIADMDLTDEVENDNIDEEAAATVTKKPKKGERYAPAEYGKDVLIKIPKNELNPNDDVIPVRINQYKWNIKRGVEVAVPEEVKKVLENANYI